MSNHEEFGLPPRVQNALNEWQESLATRGEEAVAKPPTDLIEYANRKQFEKLCRAEGLNPDQQTVSPALVLLLQKQKKLRDDIEPPCDT